MRNMLEICVRTFVITVILLLNVKWSLSECYEAKSGDFCSSLEDLKTRKSDIEVLEIVGSKADGNVDSSYFKSLTNLKKLKIFNKIRTVDTFEPLKNLQRLELVNNSLYEIDDQYFTNLPLTHLVLTGNGIPYIKKYSFSSMSNLVTLDLRDNNLRTISYGVFNNLKIQDLLLARNNLLYIQVNALDGLSNLTILDLSQNKLTKFVANELVRPGMYSLLKLDLNQNDIVDLDISPFTNLRILEVVKNKISKLKEGIFANNPNLIEVRLAANRLTTLQPDVLPIDGIQITELDLTLNRLSNIDEEFLVRLPRLWKISVCGNPWHCPCQKDFLRWLGHQKINTDCPDAFNKGLFPVCIDTANFDSECLKNVDLYEDYKKYINESAIQLLTPSEYHYIQQIHTV